MYLKGAIFDIDGTVLDSIYIWDTVAADYLRSIGIVPKEGLRETIKTMSMNEAAEYLREDYSVTYSENEIALAVNHMIERRYFEEVSPKVDAKEFLADLQAQGVAICAATSTDEYLVKAALERNDMLKYFSKIFTCSQVGKGKTEPDIFDAALLHLGTPKEETIIFEDSLYAIETAKKAGYTVAAIYDRFEPDQDEIKKLANYYFFEYNDFMRQFNSK